MSIFDRFKKTKKEVLVKKTPKLKTPKLKPAKEELTVKGKSLDEALQAPEKTAKRIEKKQFPEAYLILKSPHVTEKSGLLVGKNCYVFKVGVTANKSQIKKAVQDLYGVAVEQVNVINIHRKAKQIGRNQGFKAGFKKAMVKLSEGEKIEIMPR